MHAFDGCLLGGFGVQLYPGVAGGEAVHGDEGAVELAELLGRLVAVERDPHDRVCAEKVTSPGREFPGVGLKDYISSSWRGLKRLGSPGGIS